jgi:uncharacterized cupredoxin-like copper-binding protein
MIRRQSALTVAAVVAAMALTASLAFAQEEDEAAEMEPMAGTEVNVILQEFAVIPDVLSVPAGSVTFNAENVGPMDPHELVVVKTDLPAGELPTREDGAFDEGAEGVEIIGEIEEFDVGLTESATWDLAPGHYVLLCNLVEEEDDGLEAHYAMGMWIDFEVTEPMAGAEVGVTLQEWAVVPDALTVSAGSVTFSAENMGPVDPHELVVVRTDIAASDLPTREDGGFDEDAEGVEIIGEIEEFEVGSSESATWDLDPGHYALLCNLVELEDGETEAHYQLGMWIDFEVTA